MCIISFISRITFKMSYSIVVFTEENTVSAVPSYWFRASTKKCAWPKPSHTAASVSRLIAKRTPYNSIDFNLFDARVLKNNIGELFK